VRTRAKAVSICAQRQHADSQVGWLRQVETTAGLLLGPLLDEEPFVPRIRHVGGVHHVHERHYLSNHPDGATVQALLRQAAR
jgi:hypothetical protein